MRTSLLCCDELTKGQRIREEFRFVDQSRALIIRALTLNFEVQSGMATAVKAVVLKSNTHSSFLRPHMPELDALRGSAILFVLVFHAFYYSAPELQLSKPWSWAYHVTSWGWAGVNLFFVLSGFLITGILIDALPKSSSYFSNFYLRRALRILPVYLLTLAALLLLRFITIRYAIVSALFLANMPTILHATSEYGPLWSLAVEEQFYLVWPFLVRRLRVRGITVLSVMLCICCPALRALAVSGRLHLGHSITSKTWMIADNLAIGALISVFLRSAWCSLDSLRMAFAGMFLGSAVLATVVAFHRGFSLSNVYGCSIGMTSLLLFCGSILIASLIAFHDRVLPTGFAALVFLGDISYGLYLIHMMMLHIFDRLFLRADLDLPRHSPSMLVIRALVANSAAITAAYLSRRYFEKPILGYKQRLKG